MFRSLALGTMVCKGVMLQRTGITLDSLTIFVQVVLGNMSSEVKYR